MRKNFINKNDELAKTLFNAKRDINHGFELALAISLMGERLVINHYGAKEDIACNMIVLLTGIFLSITATKNIRIAYNKDKAIKKLKELEKEIKGRCSKVNFENLNNIDITIAYDFEEEKSITRVLFDDNVGIISENGKVKYSDNENVVDITDTVEKVLK